MTRSGCDLPGVKQHFIIVPNHLRYAPQQSKTSFRKLQLRRSLGGKAIIAGPANLDIENTITTTIGKITQCLRRPAEQMPLPVAWIVPPPNAGTLEEPQE